MTKTTSEGPKNTKEKKVEETEEITVHFRWSNVEDLFLEGMLE